MADFDFVADEQLRASLEDDSRELDRCLTAGAYKAAQVLAGSIAEALLADHLIGSSYVDPSGKDTLELDLGQLIKATRSQKAISSKTADLASAVKEYRNLIHPGRVIRTKETVDLDSASIAHHLIEVIAREVANTRKAAFGYTAQQLVAKVEGDSSSLSILGDLLKDASEQEIQRFLIRVLPARYLELAVSDFTDPDLLSRLSRAFRITMEIAPVTVRRTVAERYVRVLKDEPEFEVMTYESAFFRASDIEYLAEEEGGLAKRHLLATVNKGLSKELIASLAGIGRYADAAELSLLVDSCVRFGVGPTPGRRRLAADALSQLWVGTPSGADAAIPRRIRDWERSFTEQNRTDIVAWLNNARAGMLSFEEPDLPEADDESATEDADIPF